MDARPRKEDAMRYRIVTEAELVNGEPVYASTSLGMARALRTLVASAGLLGYELTACHRPTEVTWAPGRRWLSLEKPNGDRQDWLLVAESS